MKISHELKLKSTTIEIDINGLQAVAQLPVEILLTTPDTPAR
jgi:hypothetical protein